MTPHHKHSVCEASIPLIDKAAEDGIETIWNRLQSQLPQCNYGELGICCTNCAMGPCKINPFGQSPRNGVCGTTADTMVARNLLLHIATGAAAHSDHGRALVQLLFEIAGGGDIGWYTITDKEKLHRIAKEFAIDCSESTENTIAAALADKLSDAYGWRNTGNIAFLHRAPQRRITLWERLNILPRGIDREIVESLHRTHMGVDHDPVSLLLQGIRTALADGWAGSMTATEFSDIIFGTPHPTSTQTNLGVLKESMVNIIIHGHEPVLAEMIAIAASKSAIIDYAKNRGADGINICGMCCSGNELLSRHGIPIAGNMLQQELAITTGAVEAMVVDVQCIFPSLAPLSKCYHTHFISTSPKARFPGAIQIEFDHKNRSFETACKIIRTAADNFPNRKSHSVRIPDVSMDAITGFSCEALLEILGGSLKPLLYAIEQGSIRGIIGIVGCNNPKIRHDHYHLTLARELIRNDILVVASGCSAIACAKAGLMTLRAADGAGNGLQKICSFYRLPPILHMGSCVDISRILTLASIIARELDCDIADLPIAGAAPEWMSQKAISIATYMVGSGIFTLLGTLPPILGSSSVTNLLCNSIEAVTGGKFLIEPDPQKGVAALLQHIEKKRSTLFSGFKIIEFETVSTFGRSNFQETPTRR